ncbi:DUF6338 family protein [Allokutzneria sp. A3M-2-11 16]|uniref:DUF6338 family protein n=1 Tax=Allokutzneria sp. A3M-2-11 16 TaxID=2962043 RepID=UPI0020B805A0|nr:DUF6338 family protein [Allokutzneria sp. A3M-2-11 16]MCP3800683.1 DUF6338 family protein [Allokutzneria sp. A3M-2-11 16]
MPPSTVAGLVFLIAALSPGLVYHRMLARFSQRDSRSTIVELVEMATAGAVASAVATVMVIGAGQVVPGLVSLAELVGDPVILRAHPWSVLISAALALVLSLALAALGGWLWIRRADTGPGRIREGSAWAGVLAARHEGRPAFLAVELDDGRLVEGYFRTVSVAEDPARDVLALRRPILVSGPGEVPRKEFDEDFVLIPRSIVKLVHGKHVPPKRANQDS